MSNVIPKDCLACVGIMMTNLGSNFKFKVPRLDVRIVRSLQIWPAVRQQSARQIWSYLKGHEFDSWHQIFVRLIENSYYSVNWRTAVGRLMGAITVNNGAYTQLIRLIAFRCVPGGIITHVTMLYPFLYHSADSSIKLSGNHRTQTQTSEVRWAARFSGHWVVTSMFA